MNTARNGGDITFRTPFSPAQDLVQILRGASPGDPGRNDPVDFRLAGLQRKGHADIWHVDQVLSFSTDECAPFVINGEDIGGNHGHSCAVRACVPKHGLREGEAGSFWRDEAGMGWTLMRVETPDSLLFLSDNIGPSMYEFAFSNRIAGTLVSGGRRMALASQQGHVQLTPAIRHLKREAVCLVRGCWQPITGETAVCELAEIREEYEVINPASMAQALREKRGMGEGMLLHRMTYRVQADGTILCDFEHRLLQPVRWTQYLGVMAQERCDVFGGGVWRTIPGVRPFEDNGRLYDFSVPYNVTQGPMPDWKRVTPDLWTDPLRPPSKQRDEIRRPDGICAALFECGFLPVYDGEPARRAANITDAWEIVPSCKAYPTFAGGKDGKITLKSLRGVAYQQYSFPGGETMRQIHERG